MQNVTNQVQPSQPLVAGEAYVGKVGGAANEIIVSPVLTVHAGYVANDFVGTSATAMTFAGCGRVNGGAGYIVNAVLEDDVLASVAGELWLFSAAPAGLPNDSAAFTITDADAKTCIGVIPFQTYYASALNSVSMGDIKMPIGFECGAATTSLYGAFVTRGAPAYVADNLTFRLFVDQN